VGNYLRLSGFLVGKYLCPFEFSMGKISVYPCHLCHPRHPSYSVRLVLRESPHLQSIRVITYSSLVEFILRAHTFIFLEEGGDFLMLVVSGVGILEVAQDFPWEGQISCEATEGFQE
jgi:hypothetical protein